MVLSDNIAEQTDINLMNIFLGIINNLFCELTYLTLSNEYNAWLIREIVHQESRI